MIAYDVADMRRVGEIAGSQQILRKRSAGQACAGLLLAAAVVLATSSSFAQPVPSDAGRASPAQARVQQQPALAGASAETVGMSSERLERLTAAFQKEIDGKQLPGTVIMVARDGRLVYSKAFGVRDPAASDPMQLDTIFRIYSMTKPMASVAAMQLVDDGVLQLTDPVAKWLPEFASPMVVSGDTTVAAQRPMTVQDLLRHTSGLVYGEINQNPVIKKALTDAGLYKPDVINFDTRDLSPADFTARLAKVPLASQPGTAWEYSLSSDLLGRVIEKASGKRLGAFLQERVFQPLQMTDTAFDVPPGKMARLAASFDKDPANGAPFRLIDVSKPPGNDSGGAGAVSTAMDYLRFTQMLLDQGRSDGRHVLSPTTVSYMASDHLGSRIPMAPGAGGTLLGATTYTFGLGFAVRPQTGLAPWPGSAGDFYWGGFAGTYFWIDPAQRLTAVMMMQSPGVQRLYHRNLLRQLVYQAIDVSYDDPTVRKGGH